MMDNFRKRVIQILYFWMNRHSQRKSYTWDGFNQFFEGASYSKTTYLCEPIWII